MNQAFLLILLMMAAGKLCQRFGVFSEQAPEILNRFVIWICLPALVLLHVPRLELAPALLSLALLPWAILLLSVLLVLALSRLLSWPRATEGLLLLIVPLGNTSFLGYPLVTALLGADKLPYAVVYDQFGTFPIICTYGLYIIARYSGSEAPGARDMALRILRFPPFLALVLALALAAWGWQAEGAAEQVLEQIGAALVPVVTFAVGLSLRFSLPRAELLPLALGLLLKLVIGPLLAFLLLLPLVLPEGLRETAILEAAMPPMITAGALAIAAGLAPRLAAALVGYGILLSLLTVPLCAALLL